MAKLGQWTAPLRCFPTFSAIEWPGRPGAALKCRLLASKLPPQLDDSVGINHRRL
jgi:hypothetical protein